MKETKHTPGPWISDDLGVITGGADYATSVCETYLVKWKDKSTYGKAYSEHPAIKANREEAEANARLIAAAPELLEALERIIDAYDGPTVNAANAVSGQIDLAKMAIKKAKGTK